MADDARVSFRDAAGREPEAGLALVSAEVLAAGRPWRVFRWRQGPGDVRAAVLHVVWRGVFRTDLLVPLSSATRLERAA